MDIQDNLTEIKTVQRYNFDVTNFDDEKRTIEFVFTTNTTDRSNDIVNPKGAILNDFKKNPVFLWSHDKTKQPLGRVIEIEIEEDGSLVGTVEFWRNNIDPAYWSEADKVAVSVYEQYKNKFLNAVSIAFKPIDYKFNKQRGGMDYNTYSITEISAVTVPDNPNALRVGKSMGIDFDVIKSYCKDTLSKFEEFENINMAEDIIKSIKTELIIKNIKEMV